ncbi:WD40-repeat-containing domain protein, partial [Ochromonadaceae sp. CCMP2298]
FVHPAAVYPPPWSPTHAPVLATGCHDGTVRVFNHIMKESLIYLCVGHKLRSFGVSWSYLVAGMLASGADDKLVIVWKVQLDRSVEALSKGGVTAKVAPWRELAGHTANVRALSWNSEHRNILLSGGWDCSIRLWDAFSGNCLLVVNDHVADVYSIVSHPSRPFTYISASRDTTVRVWELEGIATRLRYQAMWDGCLDRMLDKSAFNPDKVQFKSAQKEEGEGSKPQGLSDSRSTTLLLPRMHGRTSADLNVSLSHISPKADEGRDDGKEGEERFERLLPSDPLKLAGNYYKIYSFFNGASGSLDVWENALTIFGDREASILKHTQSFSGLSLTPQLRPPGMRQVHSESEVLHAARSEARRLESSKMGLRKTELQQRGETQLRQGG